MISNAYGLRSSDAVDLAFHFYRRRNIYATHTSFITNRLITAALMSPNRHDNPQSLMQKAAEARINQQWAEAESLYREMAQVLTISGNNAELAVVLYHLAKTLESQGKYFASFETLSALDLLLVQLEEQNDRDYLEQLRQEQRDDDVA